MCVCVEGGGGRGGVYLADVDKVMKFQTRNTGGEDKMCGYHNSYFRYFRGNARGNWWESLLSYCAWVVMAGVNSIGTKS